MFVRFLCYQKRQNKELNIFLILIPFLKTKGKFYSNIFIVFNYSDPFNTFVSLYIIHFHVHSFLKENDYLKSSFKNLIVTTV